MFRLPRGVALTLAVMVMGCEVPTVRTTGLQGVSLSLDRHGPSEVRRSAETTVPGPTGDAPPTAPPSAAPTASSPPPGGGPGGSPMSATQRGIVLAVSAPGARPSPLAGATVWTSDGREALTDDDGRFRLSGPWPSDGGWTVWHPGYRASTVVGLPEAPEATLHLKTENAFPAPDAPGSDGRFTVTGSVVAPSGHPLPGVSLHMRATDGSYSGPTLTDDQGRFQMTVFAHGPTVTDAAIVALDYDTESWMGAASGLTIKAGGADVDFNPATGAADALVMMPTTHRLDVTVDNPQPELPARVFVDVILPGMTERVLIHGQQNSVRLAALPGARFGLEVEAADATRTRQSVLVEESLTIDFSTPETRYTARLLAPPAVEPIPADEPLGTIAWGAVEGARGYEVRLNSLTRRSLEWEAFSLLTSLRFELPAASPSGAYALQVLAWDADGMGPRQVASTRRDLRLLPLAGRYRWSSHETRLTL